MNWPTEPLASIAQVKLGRQRSPQNHSGPTMRKYLRAANVGWSGLILGDVKSMNFTDAEMDNFRLRPGDILLNEASGSPTEVGKPAIWNGEIEECAFQNTLLRVRSGPAVMPEYLLQYFRYQAAIGAFARGSRGVGINHLGREALAKWPVPLPDLDQQLRIAQILNRADLLRNVRGEVTELLETLRRDIYLDTFSDPEWPTVELSALCSHRDDIKCGPFGTQLQKSEVVDDGVPLWGIKNVNSAFELPAFEFLTAATGERLQQFSIIPGDIVMTRKGTVGNCAVYPGGFPAGVMHSDLLRVRVNESRAHPAFISHQLHYDPQIKHQMQAMSSGAVMPGLNVGRLKALRVKAPPVVQQRRFAERLEQLERTRSVAKRHRRQLDELLASLQSRAFSGQL